MDVAVIGGRGFVGSAVVDALDAHEVTTVDPEIGGADHVSADITREEQVIGALEDVDAVVNLAGLSPMQEPRGVSYEDIHVAGARHVVAACERNDVGRLIHMSALGADPDADAGFLRTKGEGERLVRESDLDTTVFRPSIVFDHGNELVRLAERFAPTRMFPGISTEIEPVYRGDVAELFRRAVEGGLDRDVLEVGGPDRMTIYGLARKIYHARGYRCLRLPIMSLLKLGFLLADPLPVPYGRDQARFLSLENVTAENHAAGYLDLTSVDDWLARSHPA